MGERDSVPTPYVYDENSLMNLSNSPSMMRSSNMTRYREERLISSTKLNGKSSTIMG